jgi:hypothetical protein
MNDLSRSLDAQGRTEGSKQPEGHAQSEERMQWNLERLLHVSNLGVLVHFLLV